MLLLALRGQRPSDESADARLGLAALVDRTVDLGHRVGAANPERKVMMLVSAMALGEDCIDDCDVLRSSQTGAVLGHRVAAPSALGTFLRAFTFGYVRQLDKVLAVCHAVVELAIRELKDQALAHFPSGTFLANAAWTVIAALAHNLLRWTTRIGLPDTVTPTARTLRRRLLSVPGRITRTARTVQSDARPVAMADRLPHVAAAAAGLADPVGIIDRQRGR